MKTFMSATLFVAAAAIAASAQSTAPLESLAALTVPASARPAGCALTQALPVRTPAPQGGKVTIDGVTVPFDANPWQGSDTKSAVTVLNAMEHAPRGSRTPDAPPLSSHDNAVLAEKRVEHVREAYHAEYTFTDGPSVVVNAVTFDDAKLVPDQSLSSMLASPTGIATRLVRGATLIAVRSSTTNPCARAIDTYVRSLK